MATTLMDALKQSQKQLTETQGTVPSETERLVNIAQVGQSGKAVSGTTTPRLSRLQEKVQSVANKGKLEEVKVEQQIQQQGVAQDLERVGLQKQGDLSNLNAARLNQVSDYHTRVNALLHEKESGARELDLKKENARLKNLGFMLRLSNDEYIDNLKRAGARERLSEKTRMDEEIMSAVFDEERELLESNLTFRNILRANDREFQEALAQLDLEDALAIANAGAKAAAQRSIFEGFGSAASAAASAYSTPKAAPVSEDHYEYDEYDYEDESGF